MFRATIFLALTVLLGLTSTAPAQPAKKGTPWRIALVCASTSATMNNLLDLAEAKLSTDDGLVLLDRKAVSKILTEQKLSLSGLVDSSFAVNTGKLLNANAFAIVEADPLGKEALGLVIYDADTGIKWHDATLAAGAFDQQVEAITQAVRGIVKKRNAGPKSWQTVCVLGTRNADLPRTQDHVAPTVAWLLERHLLTSPSLAVLERKRLDRVNQEKSLTGSQKELLASLVSVEIEISRADKGIRATAHLTDSQGKDLGKIRAESATGSAEELANGLLAGVVRTLQAAPVGAAPDRLRESARFAQEGRSLASYDTFILAAVQALEAAHALNPHKEEIRSELVKALLTPNPRRLLEVTKENAARATLVKQVLANGLRGYELRLQALDQAPATLTGVQAFYRNHGATRSQLRFFRSIEDGVPLDDESRDLRQAVCSAYLRMTRTEMSRAAQLTKNTAPRDPAPIEILLNRILDFLEQSKGQRHFHLQEWEAAHADALEHWIALLETPGRALAPKQVNMVMKQPHSKSMRHAELFERLSKTANPLAQLWGRYLLLDVRRLHKEITPAEADVAFHAIRKSALQTINTIPPASKGPFLVAEDLRHGCYELLHVTGENWPYQDIEAKYREHLAVCAVMLERREMVLYVFLHSIAKHNDERIKHHYHRERWDLVEQARKLLAAGDPPLLENAPALRLGVAEARSALLREHPELVSGGGDPIGPWTKARLLLAPEAIPNLRQFGPATIHGDHVYLPLCRSEGAQGQEYFKHRVDVFKIPLRNDSSPKGTNEKSWASWKLPPFGPGTSIYPGGEIRASCWGEDRLYLGTQHGIYAIDASGAATPFSKDLDLPNSTATALIFLDGKLFAALEGGYLVSIDPKSGKFETLASSSRREKLSPFDNNEVLHIRAWHVDVERDRLLMLVAQSPNIRGTYPAKQFPSKDTTNGLWEYNLKTKTFTRHVETFFYALNYLSEAKPGHLLLSHRDNGNVVAFDMKTNRCEIVFGDGSVGPAFAREKKPILAPPFPYFSSYREHAGHLWGANSASFGRITLKDGRVERFPDFMITRPTTFQLREGVLTKVGDDLLVQTWTGVWLLEFWAKMSTR